MISLGLVALFFVRLAVCAPAPLVARAPAAVHFNTPSKVTACSAPVTLSWTISPSDDEDVIDTGDIRVSRVTLVSVDGDFEHQVTSAPGRRSFEWESVNVPPGEYFVTGTVGGASAADVEIEVSKKFTVGAGDSLDCLPSTASSTTATSSPTPVASSPPVSRENTADAQSIEASAAPSPTASSAPVTSSGMNTGVVAAVIVVAVLIICALVGLFFWRRMNRSRELANVEYVYPSQSTVKHSTDHGRHLSEDTVIEVRARAPTPVNMFASTKAQMMASDLDLNQTQKMLRQL